VRPLKLLPHGNIDLYYLGIDRKEARFDQGAARETRHSVGMRLWGKMKAWDYNSEMIVQLGNFGHGKVRAWAAASDVGYTLRRRAFVHVLD
jgi:Alginate export